MGLRFTYRIQDGAGGIAQALGLAEGFVGNDRCVVILGDNIFQDSITPFVEKYKNQECGARILLKAVDDPERYGVAELKGDLLFLLKKSQDVLNQTIVLLVYICTIKMYLIL